MNPILKQISALHLQPTVAAAVLMCLRGRIEYKKGVKNRIGGSFPRPKSCLIFGRAGTGKTTLMKSVFEGFGLDGTNDVGDIVSVYHDSAGCSTTVGIAAVLEQYGEAIHFFDEFSMNTAGHVALIKQISNGRIFRQRHQNVDPFQFDGTLIAATNGVRPPPLAEVEDLLATLDRFIVVEAKPVKHVPGAYFDAVIRYQQQPQEVDFGLLSEALNNDCFDDLTTRELKFARRLWREKACEILDGGERAQYRNVKTVIDIVTFIKRILELEDLTIDEEAKSFCRQMIRDCIVLNPTGLFALTPAQRAVLNVVNEKEGTVSFQDVAVRCRTLQGAGNVHRVLNSLMSLGLLYRTMHGKYSNRIVESQVKAEFSTDKTSKKSLVEFL